MYQKVDTNLNFVDREKKVEEFWKENHIFEKSMENRKEGETYTFYDGPPTANGKPHIGHVLTRVIKDMIPRYRTMKGYMVPRKAGWDSHHLRLAAAFPYRLLSPSLSLWLLWPRYGKPQRFHEVYYKGLFFRMSSVFSYIYSYIKYYHLILHRRCK